VVKLFAEGVTVTTLEWGILAVGCVSAFLVSLAAIRFLMDFVKKHSFASFGWYRIALGVLVIGYFLLIGR
jgi:undecaprenyl-diphosphatase